MSEGESSDVNMSEGESSDVTMSEGESSDVTITVVVAEDEGIIRLDLVETLREEGYIVIGECDRGDIVLDTVRALRPDVLICDIKMPGLDGISVAKMVTDEALCAVLMLTAYSQRELIEQARDAGALAYLVKPFQRRELIPSIEIARGRFLQTQALRAEVTDLTERLEARKVIDRAKALLINEHGMTEGDAFRVIQRGAMDGRRSMRAIADLVLSGEFQP